MHMYHESCVYACLSVLCVVLDELDSLYAMSMDDLLKEVVISALKSPKHSAQWTWFIHYIVSSSV